MIWVLEWRDLKEDSIVGLFTTYEKLEAALLIEDAEGLYQDQGWFVSYSQDLDSTSLDAFHPESMRFYRLNGEEVETQGIIITEEYRKVELRGKR